MNYKEIEGIKIYNPEISDEHEDFDAKHLDNLYKAENKLFWSIIRKEYILEKFKKYIIKKSSIIEIGAGTGDVSRELMSNGYSNISVGEMHISGLKYAQTYGIKECYQFDLLKTPFENKFDVVCMFDVLEHIEDDILALEQSFKMLKNNGYMIVTVPSHMWLWNRSDRIVGHKRRYTKDELKNKMQSSGFEVIEISYFFIFITPLLFIRRILDSDDGSAIKKSESFKHLKLNSIIDYSLLIICKIENRLKKFIPNKFGGSLFVIGRKNNCLAI